MAAWPHTAQQIIKNKTEQSTDHAHAFRRPNHIRRILQRLVN
jgi:hypothetical protein